MSLRTLDDLEFSGGQAGIQVAAYLGIGDLAHAAAEAVADQRPLIDDSLALEVLVAGKSQRLPHAVNGVDGLLLMLKPFARGADDGFGLVAEVGGELAMRRHDVGWRMNLFAVARGVRGDLGRLLPGAAGALQILANLLAARAGCVQILLRVALDFRRAAAANGDLVAKLAKPVSQLRLIDGRGELLRCEKALRLDCAGLAVLALGDIEDDGMGMELRRNITIDRAGGVVLELRGNELGRGFRRMVPADACLRVMFKLLKRDLHALSMGHANTVIAAHQRGERDGFGCGKRRIPPGAMLHRLDGLAIGILVFVGRTLANKLLAGQPDAGPG